MKRKSFISILAAVLMALGFSSCDKLDLYPSFALSRMAYDELRTEMMTNYIQQMEDAINKETPATISVDKMKSQLETLEKVYKEYKGDEEESAGNKEMHNRLEAKEDLLREKVHFEKDGDVDIDRSISFTGTKAVRTFNIIDNNSGKKYSVVDESVSKWFGGVDDPDLREITENIYYKNQTTPRDETADELKKLEQKFQELISKL